MNELQEMFDRNTSTIEYDLMIHSLKPLFDCFGMNYMYHVIHLPLGGYSGIGTNIDAGNAFFENVDICMNCPVMNQSKTPSCDPIMLDTCEKNRKEKWDFNLLHNTSNPSYLRSLENLKNQFHINLSINISRKTAQETISYGFGFKDKERKVDEFLEHHLPVLYRFYDYFKEQNQKLLNFMYENQVNLTPLIKPRGNEVLVQTLPDLNKKMVTVHGVKR